MTTDSITRSAADTAHDAIDRAEDKVQPLEDQIRNAKDAIHEGDLGLPSLETVEQFIQEKPLQAAGIAFAAGVVATLLLRR